MTWPDIPPDPRLVLTFPGEKAVSLQKDRNGKNYYAVTYPAWSTNADRRQHPMERSRVKNMWKAGARYAAQQWRVKARYTGHLPFTVVQLRFHLRMAAIADPHNYCGTVLKAVIDGLVEVHFWPNDTAKYVGHRESIITREEVLPEVRLYFSGPEPWS